MEKTRLKTRLNQILLDRGMSKKQLSALTGISPTSVTQHSNNRDGLSWASIAIYCETLGIQPGELLEYDHE